MVERLDFESSCALFGRASQLETQRAYPFVVRSAETAKREVAERVTLGLLHPSAPERALILESNPLRTAPGRRTVFRLHLKSAHGRQTPSAQQHVQILFIRRRAPVALSFSSSGLNYRLRRTTYSSPTAAAGRIPTRQLRDAQRRA